MLPFLMLKNNNPLVLQYRLAAANKKKTKLSTTSAALQDFHQNVVTGNTKSLIKSRSISRNKKRLGQRNVASGNRLFVSDTLKYIRGIIKEEESSSTR